MLISTGHAKSTGMQIPRASWRSLGLVQTMHGSYRGSWKLVALVAEGSCQLILPASRDALFEGFEQVAWIHLFKLKEGPSRPLVF